jgi:hypothetical protein
LNKCVDLESSVLLKIYGSLETSERPNLKKARAPTISYYTPIGVYEKLATLNPENMPVNVISIDI